MDMHYDFFIHSSISGHGGCFHNLAIVSNAAVNIQVHASFLIVSIFFRKILRRGVIWQFYF